MSVLMEKVIRLTKISGTTLLVSKKALISYFTLMAKLSMNRLFRRITRKGQRNFTSGKTNYNAAKFYIDDLYVYDRALDADEVTDVMDGNLLPVEPHDKLSATWGQLKARRD